MMNEFQFIDKIRTRYGLAKVGDDCAVIPKDRENDLLLTADILVEDIDFRLTWSPPDKLGHKALAVSLSDIAAMGGSPTWAMLSIGVPAHLWKTDFLDRFYEGWYRLASEFDVELVGGDISRSPERLVIDSIVGGQVPHGMAITRSEAKVGDLIIVTGDLGGAAGGLRLLETLKGNETDEQWHSLLITKHLEPRPQLIIANYLRTTGIATSLIDISDGLSSDLYHLCESSGVGAMLYAEKIPINSAVARIASSVDDQLDLTLNGGEDFELLFTMNRKKVSALEKGTFTVIGEITANVGTVELMRGGHSTDLMPQGYRHF